MILRLLGNRTLQLTLNQGSPCPPGIRQWVCRRRDRFTPTNLLTLSNENVAEADRTLTIPKFGFTVSAFKKIAGAAIASVVQVLCLGERMRKERRGGKGMKGRAEENVHGA
ncbi:hypothetical protein ANANG_G00233180 [Anguilla anguilla]|uniref:Uncharacterized protein n=1 Tax=Anguilla anguilla TaxID=7936 RepID=A0A9D3LXA4_ANGAN|nr:hypothetical protein ANANG_G00233180 [Anguilla anguilla]